MILLCLIYLSLVANAQENGFNEIDRLALNIPAEQTSTTADIASYIKAHFDSDQKKVRAIYTWVASNIKYDKKSIHPVILDEDNEQKITGTLRTRKGVCENFAAVFNDVCLKSGLKSFVVEGYTKQHGIMDRSPHAWCTVLIDNKWSLYDPTWDEGVPNNNLFTGVASDEYFNVSPEIFIQSHMPFDPMFQLLNYPVSYKEFQNGYTAVNNSKPYFNYADSIIVYEQMTAMDKYLTASSRIERNGISTNMINNRMNKLKMEIEIINQDKDSKLYNSAVADYNDALASYNTFINYRNNQFKPAKPDYEVHAMFDNAEDKITSANKKVNEVKSSKAVLILDTSVIEKKLEDLSVHIKEQQDFLKNYLNTIKEK